MKAKILKIVSVVGARPQFIKAAPVSRALRRACQEILVHTGQHYDYGLSAIFFEELDIPKPDYHLGVGSGRHGWQTAQMLEAIENVLLTEEPDWLLVYGDTNSTLAAALGAVKLNIPVAHVEAGLRSFNRRMPEEHNRVLTDHIATLLLCPTETAIKNLNREGIIEGVHNIGDVMYDAVLYNATRAETYSTILERLNITSKAFCLATIHRAENTDNGRRLAAIFSALATVEAQIIFPAHPRTVAALKRERLAIPKNIILIEPVGYLDMLMLEKQAHRILTDSGGVQKEAYFLGTPCLTLRDETEWIETVETGWNVIVGSDKDKIIEALQRDEPIGAPPQLFGDGRASALVLSHLLAHT